MEQLPDVVVYRVTNKFRGPRLVKATYKGEFVADGVDFPYIQWTCCNWYRDRVLRNCFPHHRSGESIDWGWNMFLTPELAWGKYDQDNFNEIRRADEKQAYHEKCLRASAARKSKGVWNEESK